MTKPEPLHRAVRILIPDLFGPRLLNRQKLHLFKVARPGFSLSIPTLFEHEIQRCLKRNTYRVTPICRV